MATRTSQDIYQGQRITVECEFREGGVPTDPTVVQCTIRPPSGGQSTLNYPDAHLTRREEGIFEAFLTLDEGGTWWVRFEGFGTIDAVQEISIDVKPSNFIL